MPSTSIALPPFDDDLLTIEQVSRLTGYSRNGIYLARHRGLPPGNLAIKWKNRLFWRRSDLQRWLDERVSNAFDKAWSERDRKRGTPVKTHARELFDAKKKEAEAARNDS